MVTFKRSSILQVPLRKGFSKISQNLQKITCAKISFFKKLQAEGLHI